MPQSIEDIEFLVTDELIDYSDALAFMEERAALISANEAKELVWFLEHPPIFTMGTSASESEILAVGNIETIKTSRGGKTTYHGPGQRIVYLMLDLKKRNSDIRAFVCNVEKWVIAALAELGIKGEIRENRIGVWVDVAKGGEIFEQKIAAIGLRVRKWVSYHGVSINLAPDLEHFSRIIPCGISPEEFGVTSIAALKPSYTMGDLDLALMKHFAKFLGSGN